MAALPLAGCSAAELEPELEDVATTTAAITPGASQDGGAAFQIYFGYLHGHSGLSDGSGRPEDAYRHARDVADLDFFGLTEHGEILELLSFLGNFNRLKRAAQQADRPGQFAALWGFEWSSPAFGHVNIINSNDFTDAVSTPELPELYAWLAARPRAFGRFNHPGREDTLELEFLSLVPFAAGVRQMIGIETFNKDDGFGATHYTCDYPLCIADTYLDQANLLGWRLGPVGGQDNHERDWGTRNDFRVGVLAPQLTRDAIVDAHLARRFFSSEDRNLELDVRSAGQPMGSVLPVAAPRAIRVTACDGNGDSFVEARLYRNGQQIEARPTSGSCIDVAFDDSPSAGRRAYYYVIVRQADDQDGDGRGDEAISSPIWFEN